MRQWMVRLLPLALAGVLILPAAAAEAETISPLPGCYAITVDSVDIDADACMMVPLRTVAESMGFTVTWADGAALVDNGIMHTSIIPGQDRYVVATSVEGMLGTSAPFSLGVPPYAVDGVLYVPLGLFDALLGRQENAFVVENSTVEIHTHRAQLPNPFVDCQTLEQAQAVAGFYLSLPQKTGELQPVALRAVEDEMIEVVYQAGTDTICVRKALGSGDISGDYNCYPDYDTLEISGLEIATRGVGETVYVALWTSGDYTYAITAAHGMSCETLHHVVQGLV